DGKINVGEKHQAKIPDLVTDENEKTNVEETQPVENVNNVNDDVRKNKKAKTEQVEETTNNAAEEQVQQEEPVETAPAHEEP
ncbi:hypothetical protein E0F75_039880, partial [Streptomyces sp. CB02980]|nr:hypothetical protein [Streptomyces sp. CB02980]